MTGEETYTARAVALMQQDAFRQGYSKALGSNTVINTPLAREFYPLPKVKRSRLVDGESMQYQVGASAVLYTRPRGAVTEMWNPCKQVPVADLLVVADLFENPTEEVDE